MNMEMVLKLKDTVVLLFFGLFLRLIVQIWRLHDHPGDGDTCGLPPVNGNGMNKLPRWFYDRAQDRCLPFSYKGTGGNENNFLSKTICEETCAGMFCKLLLLFRCSDTFDNDSKS